MKNKLWIASVLLIANCNLIAQENKNRIGIKGGLNLSNYYAKDVNDENLRIGYHAGVFAKIVLTDHFAVQPEILYSTKGASLNYQNAFVEGVADFNLDYLDIPLLGVFSITDNINVHAGPYFGILLSSKIKNDTEGTSLFDFEDGLDKEDFNAVDAGISAGAAIDYSRLSFGARYNYGLSNVGKEKTFSGETYTFPNAKNSIIQFYVALSLL